MPAIQIQAATVYLAPTKGRRYLTARSAAKAEAAAKLESKYPTEHAEYENGRMYYAGYHWSEDERLLRVQTRYARLLMRHLQRATLTQ